VKESVACYTVHERRILGLHYRAILSVCSLQQITVGTKCCVFLKQNTEQFMCGVSGMHFSNTYCN